MLSEHFGASEQKSYRELLEGIQSKLQRRFHYEKCIRPDQERTVTDIFEKGNRWICANLFYEYKEYIFEILTTPSPTKLGIFSGRIAELYLYDPNDQMVAEYRQKWIIGPEKGTDAYKIVGQILKDYNRKKGRNAA